MAIQQQILKNIIFFFKLFSFVKLKLDKERELQLGVKGFQGNYHYQGEFTLNVIKIGASDSKTLNFNYFKFEDQFHFNHKELEKDVKIQFDQLKGKNEYSYKILANGKSLKESKFNNVTETIQLKAEKIKKYCNNFLEICEIKIIVRIEDRKKTESRLKITVTSFIKEDDESDKPSDKTDDENDKTSDKNDEESDKTSDGNEEKSDKTSDENEEESDKASDKNKGESDKSSDKNDEESDKTSDRNEEESDKTNEESDKANNGNEEESDEGSAGNQDRKEEKNEKNKPNDGNDNDQSNGKSINGGDGDEDDDNKVVIVVLSILGVVILISIDIGLLYYYYFKIHSKNKNLNSSINEISFKDDERNTDDYIDII